jgi:TorA maturation chaperone TorD
MAPEGEAPRLLGPAHHSALAWYRRYGFAPARETEPAGHIGLLLLFYAHLLDAGAEDAALDEFERDHLDRVPRFAARLQAEARLPRYLAAAAALAAL